LLSIISLLLDADVLHYIETELQTHYKNIKINKEKQWKEGELCIAQYHHNQKWYRGRIVKNLGNAVRVRNNLSIIIFNYTIFLHYHFFLSFILYLGGICRLRQCRRLRDRACNGSR